MASTFQHVCQSIFLHGIQQTLCPNELGASKRKQKQMFEWNETIKRSTSKKGG